MIIAPLLSVSALSAVLCVYLASRYSFLKLLDVPNERSLHQVPTPRTGGVGILLTLLAAWAALAWKGQGNVPALYGFIAAYVGIAAISLVDDYRQVRPLFRFTVHLAASLVPCFTGFWLHKLELPGLVIELPAWLGMLLTVFYSAWMINLYNFMDGMDGFAGGMTVFGFGTLAWLAYGVAGGGELAIQSAVIAAAALGFLLVNFPPARLFLGDVGSAALGYGAAFFSLWADRIGVLPLWACGLLFSPFIVDATVTLLRRAWNGEKLSQPHRTHFYQRLVGRGWSHRRAVLVEYALMATCAGSAILAARCAGASELWWMIVGWVLVYALLIRAVQAMERSRA